MFLIGCVALFLLVIVTALVKAKSPGGQATRKNSKKNKPNKLGKNPLDDVKINHHDALQESDELDADTALGLKAEAKEPVEAARQSKPAVEIAQNQDNPQPLKYIVLHVMAPSDKEFGGYELLQALLSNGLRYGKNRIFNFHQNKHGQSEVLFSLASVNKPGTFDLPKMSQFSCPGLTLFLVIKDVSVPEDAFESMLKVAKQISLDLGGDVYNENRELLMQNEIKAVREALLTMQKSHKTADLFE